MNQAIGRAGSANMEYIEPPANTPEFIWPAWYSCLRWAVGEKEIMGRFTAETGIKFHPETSPLDWMIDDATGANKDFVFKFCDWFNENIWGNEEL